MIPSKPNTEDLKDSFIKTWQEENTPKALAIFQEQLNFVRQEPYFKNQPKDIQERRAGLRSRMIVEKLYKL